MMVKNFLAIAVMGATAAMVGCGGSSNSSSGGGDNAPGVTRGYTGTDYVSGEACGTVATGKFSGLEIQDAAGNFTPLCDLEGNIQNDATLTTDFVYRLNGYVTVGTGFGESGAVNAAYLDDAGSDADVVAYMKGDGSSTLTINEGVQFRSSGRGSLVISRGSKIMANGTAANPIVMSSLDVGFDGQGEWGGLVLQGFAKNNDCGEEGNVSTDVICDAADEAGTGFHGGNDDSDSSGSISHLIVAEGGFEIAPDSEVNGITLHSVGYGTAISDVMVYGNADDGVEWFGGAANIKNLILVDNGDESLDWDNGWRGNVQFVLVRQGVANKGDHGIEADTLGSFKELDSAPVIANVTFQQNAKGADDLFRFKKATNGKLINVAADGYSECVKAEGSDVDVTLVNVIAECEAYDTTSDNHNYNYVTGGKKVGDGTDAAAVLAADNAAIASITGIDTAGADTFGDNTVTLGANFEVTSQHTLATLTDADFASANGSTGFFTTTDYVGAVDPDAAEAWWKWAEAVIPAAFQ
jgi:hypothetical protein